MERSCLDAIAEIYARSIVSQRYGMTTFCARLRRVGQIPWRRLADVTKAQRRFGFKAQVSLEEGLRKLVDWWSNEVQTKEEAAAA